MPIEQADEQRKAATPNDLILLSGLGADSAMFGPQLAMFPGLKVLRWLEPLTGETLDQYAMRMLGELGEIESDTWIGGASFGGIVALHMAEHVRVRGVILLGSVRSPQQLPLYVRAARVTRWATPLIPVRFLQLTLLPMLMWIADKRWPRLYGLAWQLRRASPRVIRWSIKNLLAWHRVPVVTCPIHHIHGERDMVLPARLTTPDCIVPGGGHIVSLTHPNEVNAYLARVMNGKS